MKKRKANKPPTQEPRVSVDGQSSPLHEVPIELPKAWRLWVSLLVGLQLLVITAEPLRFFSRSPRGNSPATDPVRDTLAPLVEFGYFNHGYFFFAPEPGPSHLLDFRFADSEGQRVLIRFPDRQAQWPRLLYHRHFMLTENLNQLWVPPVDPNLSPSDPMGNSWRIERARFEDVRDSMNRHVQNAFGATSPVEMDRILHELPLMSDVVDGGMSLRDPRLYVTLPDADRPTPPTVSDTELIPPVAGPSLEPKR